MVGLLTVPVERLWTCRARSEPCASSCRRRFNTIFMDLNY